MYFDRRQLQTEIPFQPRSTPPTVLDRDLGTDLKLEDGDLAITQTSDLATNKGVSNVVDSLFRRLATPKSGYERFVRSRFGVTSTNDGSENSILNSLSAKNSGANYAKFLAELRRVAALDGRIEVVSVEPLQSNDPTEMRMNLTYRIKGESALQLVSYRV